MKELDISGMCYIFGQAFPLENPRLSQLMYAGHCPDSALDDTLMRYLPSEYSKFMVAFDISDSFDVDMSCGWLSVGIVPQDAHFYSYVASDLSIYLALKMLGVEARDRGEDPRQLNRRDPRVCLVNHLRLRSLHGQTASLTKPYMVVNTLALWPDTHSDSVWETAFKLLGWAVKCAEKHDWPIWAQTPVDQSHFFRQAGFTEVWAFTSNLNNYTSPDGNDWGYQQWVQMVYYAPERRAKSTPPKGRDGRRRRPSI